MLRKLIKMAVKTNIHFIVQLDDLRDSVSLLCTTATAVSRARSRYRLYKDTLYILQMHFKAVFYRPLINKGLHYNTIIQIYPPIYKYIGVKTPYIF